METGEEFGSGSEGLRDGDLYFVDAGAIEVGEEVDGDAEDAADAATAFGSSLLPSPILDLQSTISSSPQQARS